MKEKWKFVSGGIRLVAWLRSRNLHAGVVALTVLVLVVGVVIGSLFNTLFGSHGTDSEPQVHNPAHVVLTGKNAVSYSSYGTIPLSTAKNVITRVGLRITDFPKGWVAKKSTPDLPFANQPGAAQAQQYFEKCTGIPANIATVLWNDVGEVAHVTSPQFTDSSGGGFAGQVNVESVLSFEPTSAWIHNGLPASWLKHYGQAGGPVFMISRYPQCFSGVFRIMMQNSMAKHATSGTNSAALSGSVGPVSYHKLVVPAVSNGQTSSAVSFSTVLSEGNISLPYVMELGHIAEGPYTVNVVVSSIGGSSAPATSELDRYMAITGRRLSSLAR